MAYSAGARRSTALDSSMLRGTRLRLPGKDSTSTRLRDATQSSRSTPRDTYRDTSRDGSTALEQRLRERDTNNKLLAERDSLKEQLKEAWAAKDAAQNVMEVECRSLVQRLQDLESDLSSGRAERDNLAEALQQMEMERDKWKSTCMSTTKGLEDVLEERDTLKRELQAALSKNDKLSAEARDLKGMLQSTGNADILDKLASAPVKAENYATSPVSSHRPMMLNTKSSTFPLDVEPLSLDDVAEVLEEMQMGQLPTEDEIAGILRGTADLLLGEAAQMIIEIDVDTSEQVQEVNVCGDLGGQVENLWRVFEINGKPDEDNPYIFNGDIFQRHSTDLAAALFALKLLYPTAVHILRSNAYRGSSPQKQGRGDAEHAAALDIITSALPLGAMLNNEVLILHADLFAEDCRRAISPPVSPATQRQQLPELLPYPTADPQDPVFLQQLKGLESAQDTTVATIRVTPCAILLPDNARFMVFRASKQFGCVAYFGEPEESPHRSREREREHERHYSPTPSDTWAHPRGNDGSQTVRASTSAYGTYGSHNGAYSTYQSGSITHRDNTQARETSKVKPAPKMAYNAYAEGRTSQSKRTSDYAPSSKATHETQRATAARAGVPKLNLGSLAAMERQTPAAVSSGIPPPNARGRAVQETNKTSTKAAVGSLTSRVEREAARYAQEYMRSGSTTARDSKEKATKAAGSSSLSGLRRPLVMKQPRAAADSGLARWR